MRVVFLVLEAAVIGCALIVAGFPMAVETNCYSCYLATKESVNSDNLSYSPYGMGGKVQLDAFACIPITHASLFRA